MKRLTSLTLALLATAALAGTGCQKRDEMPATGAGPGTTAPGGTSTTPGGGTTSPGDTGAGTGTTGGSMGSSTGTSGSMGVTPPASAASQ